MHGVPRRRLVWACSGFALILAAAGLRCSSTGSGQRAPPTPYQLWVPGPTPDPPSEQATACTDHQAEAADRVIIDHRLSEFDAGTVAAQDPRMTPEQVAMFLPTMERVRLEIAQAALSPCAHRAQRYVLEYMQARLVQLQARVGHADATYIAATRRNAEAWDKVLEQELAALVERDFRNSNKP